MGAKYDRYVEAFKRIDSSIHSEYYFEAITIQESVISDRVASFLEATDSLTTEQIHRQTFANLIMLWRLAIKNPGSIWENCDELISDIDKWRKDRNTYVHGLVKFPYKKKNVPSTQKFLEGAKETAIKGKNLAAEICEWRKRQIQIKRKHSIYTKKQELNLDFIRK